MTEPGGSTIVFAGGGSGGHLTPGLALAESLADIVPDHRAVFACSTRQIDADILSAAGATMHPIAAFPPSLHPRRFLRFVRAHRRAVRDAKSMLRAERARVVIALGGFVAVPVVTAAHRLG
ncbi:MAG: glycosyltransferase, partial [Phycisphaerales bacterium]|nr:glycosyltransferase [Phycisphaerales bacterium]